MSKFKARARALDMLGRQQIAGIPTAISELFKNAHDAYADNAEIDYFRTNNIFVLRDDGFGMTKSDFEDKWLILGTESKFNKEEVDSYPAYLNKPPRPIMGEKGIGRLSIASIGPQVLVVTRALRSDGLSNTFVALINWTIFELPGLDLDDIIIPTIEIQGGTIPDEETIKQLKVEFADNVKRCYERKKINNTQCKRILEELNSFTIIPRDMFQEDTIGPCLFNDGHGTHFFIQPANEMLKQDIDGYSETNKYKTAPLFKSLLGFSNTMIPNTNDPVINFAFRDYKDDDEEAEDLFKKYEFFTPEDFVLADHHFLGEFDEYGNFEGSVSLYNEKPFIHPIHWEKANKKTECGPFKIKIAYMQGKLSQSKITPEDHNKLKEKTNKIGGLYIYRNNIRVLPYGDSDYDFLDIELKRNLSASYYYFSYRRIIGAVLIDKEKNSNLIEKAGREGFIENKAYKQFKDILQSFFEHLVADFFRENSKDLVTDIWIKQREELQQLYELKKKEDEKKRKKKREFEDNLFEIRSLLDYQIVSTRVNNTLNKYEAKLINLNKKGTDEIVLEFINSESEVRNDLKTIKKDIYLAKPSNISIGKINSAIYDDYLIEYQNINKNIFLPAEQKINELTELYSGLLKNKISRKKRLEAAISEISKEVKESSRKEANETEQSVKKFNQDVIDLTKMILKETRDNIENIKKELSQIAEDEMSDEEFVNQRIKLETDLIEESDKKRSILIAIRDQIQQISFDGSSLVIQKMNEDEKEDLKEKVENDISLVQTGMAIGIIQHEFNHTVIDIRKNVRNLKSWADLNPETGLDRLYSNIKYNFDHLDSYLSMFTPLERRLNRKKAVLVGHDIAKYLSDLFEVRLARHNIKLKVYKSFKTLVLNCFPSTFYPVFINIVDNAIFWLKNYRVGGDKIVLLHVENETIRISNNGLPLNPIDKSSLFEYGYSKKPGGHGMGLYISREVLKKEGYSIDVLLNEYEDFNVTFEIKRSKI